MLASIHALSPSTPVAESNFQKLTVLGDITTFETELGSYLYVVWPNPTVEDLGIYTCEVVVVGEMGQLVPLKVQARVTTGDPMIDRLLAAFNKLEQQVGTLNQTVNEVQSQMQNASGEAPGPESDTAAEGEMEDPATDVTDDSLGATPPEETMDTQGVDGAETQEEPAATKKDELLEKLGTAMEKMDSKLNRFNASLNALEKKLATLEEDEAEDNETDSNGADQQDQPQDTIRGFFVGENGTYFLLKSALTDSHRAQAVCEQAQLQFSGVGSAQELQAFSDNFGTGQLEEALTLIDGRRRASSTDWTSLHSGNTLDYFSWGAGEPVDSPHNDCLALKKVGPGLEMVTVPCSIDQKDVFFVCIAENVARPSVSDRIDTVVDKVVDSEAPLMKDTAEPATTTSQAVMEEDISGLEHLAGGQL